MRLSTGRPSCWPATDQQVRSSPVRSTPVLEAAVEFGVYGVGFSELIFEDDYAARRIERGATIDQFTCPGCDPKLISGVTAVAAFGALGRK